MVVLLIVGAGLWTASRAVYFVEEFPTGTLDKILKNKLREMADEHPAVD